VIDTATDTISGTIGTGKLPNGVAASPDDQRAYAANGRPTPSR
jgi:DNA-binding beta-propeller fold protein YncE